MFWDPPRPSSPVSACLCTLCACVCNTVSVCLFACARICIGPTTSVCVPASLLFHCVCVVTAVSYCVIIAAASQAPVVSGRGSAGGSSSTAPPPLVRACISAVLRCLCDHRCRFAVTVCVHRPCLAIAAVSLSAVAEGPSFLAGFRGFRWRRRRLIPGRTRSPSAGAWEYCCGVFCMCIEAHCCLFSSPLGPLRRRHLQLLMNVKNWDSPVLNKRELNWRRFRWHIVAQLHISGLSQNWFVLLLLCSTPVFSPESLKKPPP